MFEYYSELNNMPVFEWDLDLQASEWDWREAGTLPEMFDVSEDFWRKFEELPDLGDDLESLLESTVCSHESTSVLRHHDCMWAGTCLSKEHRSFVTGTLPAPQPKPPASTPVIRQPTSSTSINAVIKTSPEKPKREPRRKGVIVQKTVGRSLLINSRSRVPEPTRPETPPSLSESEEDERKTISVVPVSEVTNQVSIRRPAPQQPPLQSTNLNVQFDHNYDKVRLDDLGVQTPSDSEEEEDEEEDEGDEDDGEEEQAEEDSEEEEIDVVSLNNTSGVARMRNQPSSLPYNPSRELCRELQNTMATAITSNKLLTVNRTVNRRISNVTSRRKRKRDESEDDDEDDDDDDDEEEEDEEEQVLVYQQHQQALINSRIMPTSNSSTSSSSPTSNSSPSRYHHSHHRKNWRRTGTPKKSRFSTDSETDCEKRSLHNNMERMRRIGLRNAFEDLRVLIPSLKDSKRVAKVNILKDSADYVQHLTDKERDLAHQVVSLRQDQEKLRSRLSKLRRSLAAHR